MTPLHLPDGYQVTYLDNGHVRVSNDGYSLVITCPDDGISVENIVANFEFRATNPAFVLRTKPKVLAVPASIGVAA